MQRMIISFDQHVFVDRIDLRQTHSGVEAVSHWQVFIVRIKPMLEVPRLCTWVELNMISTLVLDLVSTGPD
jgi:hypothetical protein